MITLIDSFGKEHPITEEHFPDGTLLLDNLAIGSKCRKKCLGPKVKKIRWNYESDAELFTLMCLRHVYDNDEVALSIPYLPHARMDRVKNPHDTFTLKVFCKAINNMNFKYVEVFDVHSNVSLALLDRVKNIEPSLHVRNAIFNIFPEAKDAYIENMGIFPTFTDFVLFFPDEGAMKRYSDMFKIPYTFGVKDRDWQTGRIKSLNLMNPELIKNKTVLIVDDICSRGGTFKFSSEALKNAGAKEIYLYVSHAENTMVEGEMYNGDVVKNIFTTDSLFNFSLDVKNKVIKV